MTNNIIPLTKKIAEIANKKGVNHLVLSPGSRSAPLTLAFTRHPKIKTYVIPDERSAGYIALGMSIILNQPVGIVCTSGTASINLYPSITEAYYQNVPLIIFTADRPPEWIDQADGQTLHQANLYNTHVKKYYDYPSDQNFNDIDWYAERIVNEAINCARESPKGPVHLNVPVREPFYPDPEDEYTYDSHPKIINTYKSKNSLDEKSWDVLRAAWQNSKNILLVAGQGRYDYNFNRTLGQFIKQFNLPVVGDCISNIHALEENLITHQDLILFKQGETIKMLIPDLLITFGKSVLSKNLKLFLRNNPPAWHWHIQEKGYVSDTFKSLTSQIKLLPEEFLHQATIKLKGLKKTTRYLNYWRDSEILASDKINSFFPKDLYSEIEAVYQIIQHLPDNINLHVANSMPVRLVNLIGSLKPRIEVFSNRGVSGIDGCTSTALGISIHSDKLNILITGDMAFFYDRNGLWHNNIPENFRIIILNNYGSGIFRLIDGPYGLPELEEFFETHHNLTAQNSAFDFGMEYFHCEDADSLQSNIIKLLENDGKAKILEIATNSQINKTIFDKYISQFE
jgi:2-succinyl-5-enolpyruvyl-6-hydroxy-3-cyclohexene-1-carboxylate synthase